LLVLDIKRTPPRETNKQNWKDNFSATRGEAPPLPLPKILVHNFISTIPNILNVAQILITEEQGDWLPAFPQKLKFLGGMLSTSTQLLTQISCLYRDQIGLKSGPHGSKVR
jgi:hypothetical protein